MPPLIGRLRAVLTDFVQRFLSVFSDSESSNTVTVNVEFAATDADGDTETSISRKTSRAIRVRGFETALKLQGGEVGQLTEESIVAVFDAHPNCNKVRHIIVTHHAQLSNIPLSIGKFVNLTLLDFSSNNLQDLPWSIVYLRNLKILDLSDNQFYSVPPIIGHLTTLEVLILDNNYLRYLPTSLIHLSLLKELKVSGNINMTNPHGSVCQQGTNAIIEHLRKRHGRSNLWSNCKQHYTEPGSSPSQGDFKMKSLLEICVASVLHFKVDYFAQAYLPPPLKRHLHNKSLAEREAVKVCKCSRCRRFFSTQANFDGHDCIC